MSAPDQPAGVIPPQAFPGDRPLKEFLLSIADHCARFDSPGTVLHMHVPTERGVLIVDVSVLIVQPLPRLN